MTVGLIDAGYGREKGMSEPYTTKEAMAVIAWSDSKEHRIIQVLQDEVQALRTHLSLSEAVCELVDEEDYVGTLGYSNMLSALEAWRKAKPSK